MTLPTIPLGNSLGHRAVARIARSTLGIKFVRTVGPHIDPALIRLTGGRLSCVFPFPALLLIHTGGKSGATRNTPLVYFTDESRVVVIASNFGAADRPSWYYNVMANPEVWLLGRGFSGRFRAQELVGPDRDRLFGVATATSSPYAAYQRMVGARPIPVIAFYPTH